MWPWAGAVPAAACGRQGLVYVRPGWSLPAGRRNLFRGPAWAQGGSCPLLLGDPSLTPSTLLCLLLVSPWALNKVVPGHTWCLISPWPEVSAQCPWHRGLSTPPREEALQSGVVGVTVPEPTLLSADKNSHIMGCSNSEDLPHGCHQGVDKSCQDGPSWGHLGR
jgi:hypothetical protein